MMIVCAKIMKLMRTCSFVLLMTPVRDKSQDKSYDNEYGENASKGQLQHMCVNVCVCVRVSMSAMLSHNMHGYFL